MTNKFIHGLTSLLVPLGVYGADSHNYILHNNIAYNRLYERSTAASVDSSISESLSSNIEPKSLDSYFLPSAAITGEVQLSRRKRELVIIDEAVPDKQLLSSYLRAGVEIIQINSGQDGLTQLEEILAGYQDLDALHIVSHGGAGEMYLGDTLVDTQQLQLRPSVLAAMDKALNDNADLLLYGCDIASTDKGNQLLQTIAKQANVDVAASDDLTGNGALGGDWDLEIAVGQIDTEQPFSEIALQDFSQVLQTTENFQGLGFDDSGGAGFKTVGVPVTSNIVVSNTFADGTNTIFWDATVQTATLKVQADEDDAETFDVNNLHFLAASGQTVPIDSTSQIVFFDKIGNVLQTMTLNADKNLTDTSTDLFAFFDNNTTSPVTGVFLIELHLVIDSGSGLNLDNVELESMEIANVSAPGGGGGGDVIPPTISAVSIANSAHKVGDTVTATITVTSDADDYTSGAGGISGTIAGYTLGSLDKTNDTTYTATFAITDGGTDIAAGSTVPVNLTLDDSTGNASLDFTTAISQASDAIYANVPDVTLTADTNTIGEDGGVSTLTATLSNSLGNQWPADVTVNLAYTGTGTAGTDYSKSDSITISAGNPSNTSTVTGTADTLFDAAAAETAIVDIDSLSVGNESAPNQQTINITDAEAAPTVSLSVGSASISENGGTSVITAQLSHATYADTTVNLTYTGTAVGGGTDYGNPSASITIPALALNANAVTGITAVNDGNEDGDLTVIVDIDSVAGGGGTTENGAQQKTINITDDDGAAPAVVLTLEEAQNILDDYYDDGLLNESNVCAEGFDQINGVCTISESSLTNSVNDLNTTLDNIQFTANDVSTETELAIENFVKEVNTLLSNGVTGITTGNISTNSALDLLSTATDALQKAGDATQAGGDVDSTKIENSLSGITDIFTALDDSGTTLSNTQLSTANALTNRAVMATSDMIDDSTDADEAEDLIDKTSDVINAHRKLTGEISSELVSNAQALSQNALEKTLDDIADELNVNIENVDTTNTGATQALLKENPVLLEKVVEKLAVSLTDSSMDSLSATEESEFVSAGLSDSSASALATDLNQFTNPDGVSISTPSGTVTATDAIENAIGSGTTATVDKSTKTVALTSGDQELSVAVQSTKLVPESIPNGVTMLSDGSSLSVANGIASNLVPASVDPVGLTKAVNDAGATLKINTDGKITADLGGGTSFSASFSFEVTKLSSSPTATAGVTFSNPTSTDQSSASYNFKVNYPTARTQTLLPAVKDDDFFDSLRDRGLNFNTNRSNGIISLGSRQNVKPDFTHTTLSLADQQYLDANKDVKGVAYRKIDANNDGVDDWEVISSTGKQIVYGVP